MQLQVSVVIPCYRCSDTIHRAVDSVLQQTLQADEIILVDDCSDDAGATLAVLRALQQAKPSAAIRVVALEKNCGPGGARNAAWAVAEGRFLAFLDADDSWHPSKLQIQLAWMQEHPEVVLCASKSMQLQNGVSTKALDLPVKAHRVSNRKLLMSNCFPTRTVMLRRDILPRFDPAKRYAEDYLLWLRIVLSGMPAFVLNVPLGYSHKAEYGASGLSANLWKMERGVMDAYQRLYADGLLSGIGCIAFTLFSLMKFARRLLLCALVDSGAR